MSARRWCVAVTFSGVFCVAFASAAVGVKGEFKADEHTIALWHLNEAAWTGAAGEVKDASGNAHHGTAAGGATTAAAGRFGRCADFTEKPRYVAFDNGDGRMDLCDKSYSLELWLKPGDFKEQYQPLYNCSSRSRAGFHVYFHGRKIYYHTSIGGKWQALWSPKLALNEWYYVAVTRDFKTGETILYVNGEKADAFTVVGQPDEKDGLSHTLGNPNAPTGLIDEVRISGIARTAQDIRAYFAGAK